MLTDATIESWLREDVGHHDVTNDVPGAATGRLVATESGVVAGVDAATRVFDVLGADGPPRGAGGGQRRRPRLGRRDSDPRGGPPSDGGGPGPADGRGDAEDDARTPGG